MHNILWGEDLMKTLLVGRRIQNTDNGNQMPDNGIKGSNFIKSKPDRLLNDALYF